MNSTTFTIAFLELATRFTISIEVIKLHVIEATFSAQKDDNNVSFTFMILFCKVILDAREHRREFKHITDFLKISFDRTRLKRL